MEGGREAGPEGMRSRPPETYKKSLFNTFQLELLVFLKTSSLGMTWRPRAKKEKLGDIMLGGLGMTNARRTEGQPRGWWLTVSQEAWWMHDETGAAGRVATYPVRCVFTSNLHDALFFFACIPLWAYWKTQGWGLLIWRIKTWYKS